MTLKEKKNCNQVFRTVCGYTVGKPLTNKLGKPIQYPPQYIRDYIIRKSHGEQLPLSDEKIADLISEALREDEIKFLNKKLKECEDEILRHKYNFSISVHGSINFFYFQEEILKMQKRIDEIKTKLELLM
jgi:hypothetical protein